MNAASARLIRVRAWRILTGNGCRGKRLLPSCNLGVMKAYRSSILYFPDPARPHAVLESDGLLVVGPDARGRQVVQALGSYAELAPRFADVPTEHFPGRIIAPGFIDLHIHFPQTDVIGSPADGLLPWLENYTFPHEKRFSAPHPETPPSSRR